MNFVPPDPTPRRDRAPSKRRGDGGFLVLSIAFLISGGLAFVMLGGLHGESNGACVTLWVLLALPAFYRVIRTWNGSRNLGGLSGSEKASFAFATLGFLIGGWGTFGPRTDPHVYHYRERLCADNLRAIGQALSQYGERYGSYPDRLEWLIGTTDLQPQSLTCPLSKDRPASGASKREVRDELDIGGHLSYLFAGVRLRPSEIKPEQVIALDRVTNHGWISSINVLFGDGHVESYSVENLQRLFQELNGAIGNHP